MVSRKDRNFRRNISEGNLNHKKVEISKNNYNNNYLLSKNFFDSPRKEYKKARYSSLDYERDKEKKKK